MSCCKDKKSLSELCEKCAKDFMTGGSCEQYSGDIMVTDWAGSIPPEPRCECGAEKTGGPGHSYWCPKGDNK